MGKRNTRSSVRALLTIGTAAFLQSLGASAATSGAAELVAAKCAACHQQLPGGGHARIDESRRTPEGWDMTVVRMMQAHGVQLSQEERRTIVKHLADTRGLAPAESPAYRYILERQPSVVEAFEDKTVGETCARCHSYARIAMQRRTEEDWRRLSHFHVGQFPAIEVQQAGRDRDWWQIASRQVPQLLAKLYPNQSPAWEAWQARPKADLSGTWRIAGRQPGSGDYEGSATIRKTGNDEYAISMELRYASGAIQKAEGNGVVFTGHEWRGTVRQGSDTVLQIFSLSEDGQQLKGRWHLKDTDSVGGELLAARADQGGKPAILAVTPGFIKAGTRQQLTIQGTALSGDVSLGAGTRIAGVVRRSLESITVEVEADAGAATGPRDARVGATTRPGALSVYRQVDYLRIVPEHPMARVGGNGGARPKVPAQMEAIAYALGADGKPGTTDDVMIGHVPAEWSMTALNAKAANMKDERYAGRLQADGLFVPGDAGPNPRRKFGTNNAGELKITARIKDGDRSVSASAPLMVTVQRWNDPPIR